MKKAALFLTALLSGVLSASGVAQGQEIVYDSLSVGYLQGDVTLFESETDYDFTGLEVSGRFSFGESFFLAGSLMSLENDDFDAFAPTVETFDLGVGGFLPISASTDLYAIASYRQYELEFGSILQTDDTGFAVTAGVRSLLASYFELEMSVTGSEIDGSTNTVFDLIGRFPIVQYVAPEVRFRTSDDSTFVGLGAQLTF